MRVADHKLHESQVLRQVQHGIGPCMGLEQCAGSQTIKKPEKLLIEYLASDSWSRQNVASIGVMS